MIAKIETVARLLNFAIALWILGVVFWGLLLGKDKVDTPMIAVWLFLLVAMARLLLWVIAKAVART